ncbi:hypothetical protein FDP41_000596 [Naegleria fowleri]|uniref:Transmembrane protein n=1 Tax=Naegleria fowleri TaxID=5763 RepID=A0A6A5C5X8_NAEFO|nr:uncharacterized protein FDP41_000596 [Naegleria fowleri]KAF0984697.1 hypothetical protein FDP41_000596 [Naegleria fowleri]
MKPILALFALILSLMSLLFIANFVQAQQCKNRNPFTNSSACSSCTFCTATASSSCCSAVDDNLASASANAAKLISTQCYDQVRMSACAICDPKNQQYVVNGTLVVCKSACQRLASACGGATSACDSMPTTDCWSGAFSVIPKMEMLVAMMMMSIGVLMMMF